MLVKVFGIYEGSRPSFYFSTPVSQKEFPLYTLELYASVAPPLVSAVRSAGYNDVTLKGINLNKVLDNLDFACYHAKANFSNYFASRSVGRIDRSYD